VATKPSWLQFVLMFGLNSRKVEKWISLPKQLVNAGIPTVISMTIISMSGCLRNLLIPIENLLQKGHIP